MTATSRRGFLQASVGASAFAMAAHGDERGPLEPCQLPEAFAGLKPLGSRVEPISAEEFHERVLKAQKLMSENSNGAAASRLDALFFAPGTSQYYFTGVHWQTSERLLALVIPRTGEPLLVVPAFEEGRLREQLHYSAEIRAWQEDESPTALVAASAGGPRVAHRARGRRGTGAVYIFHAFTAGRAGIGVRAGGRDHNKLPRA